MKIICVSDTHGYHEDLDIPDGDVLIFAGDYTSVNSYREIILFAYWLDNLPIKKKDIRSRQP